MKSGYADGLAREGSGARLNSKLYKEYVAMRKAYPKLALAKFARAALAGKEQNEN